MISYLEQLLQALRPAFSRQAAFGWFIIAIVGFVMRTDTYGVSSIIRALCLTPLCYPCLLHFFHSSAWSTQFLLQHWWLWMIRQNVEYQLHDRIVLTGDHTKNVKDGRRIPDVETLHQDSETGSKPSYFRGHHWGCIALLTSVRKKFWSTPMWAEIHRSDLDEKRSTRIVSAALSIVQTLKKKGYLVLDAFFAVGPVFTMAHSTSNDSLHIVTRAKKNVTAFLPAGSKKKGKRGPKPTYGRKLKLMKLFDSDSTKFKFTTVDADIYGTTEAVRCLVLDLLWRPIKGVLRFILIESSHGRIILITNDLSLSAKTAIFLYCRRASIETLFNSLKNLLGGLCYHFWSKYLQPSSRRPARKGTPKPISLNPEKTKITLEAIEKFVVVQIIVLGILQVLALKFPKEIISKSLCWMRTPPEDIPSEFMTKIALSNIFRNNLTVFAKNMITLLIRKRQKFHSGNGFLEEAAA
ncbi:MAG: hypothetical protein A2487_01145 [Candidatus Raymondbacteria bacterium RifOxyC12_full_50_8]|uniref:Transposase IS701-like DDE domain-containing protein n=1 Tax=Candidatus Raymondbacteria bacterium RIFOXYD12_FULL_49_13 TaxID=1817890 RepID=A0A1F7F978_UNCRA|nr:MAG: hypothetical protein A2248_09785 [Candidatus Raymondbacteria bacterium RIFOXYA2_FULL_49_16]OGJ91852.1 MAG: hypothetical protein A2350_21505 [Candidatus Raymondbacteria bacterium RifOxyB12_full_50_8]OGJ95489.1 MAG: hypothetical protein A2487_01145 [Candidatus Raymondbacteria bacterium RifOxyC12_full_50_8]OGJ97194.1 MAG: hypothetical protein A2453_10430 [Candidatus Raymondbacteria bacterium RIFOXYC2_FULL_50_21]OGK03220.1 MAG: hypothetical protein A2519_05180 [Candidatus Raymondbacteria ba